MFRNILVTRMGHGTRRIHPCELDQTETVERGLGSVHGLCPNAAEGPYFAM